MIILPRIKSENIIVKREIYEALWILIQSNQNAYAKRCAFRSIDGYAKVQIPNKILTGLNEIRKDSSGTIYCVQSYIIVTRNTNSDETFVYYPIVTMNQVDFFTLQCRVLNISLLYYAPEDKKLKYVLT